MLVRFSETYVKTPPRYASVRHELESQRRVAASAVTLAMGAMVFASVFAAAMYFLA